ncbi:MAG: hypothetical protein QGD89_09305, partial [Actinomycetota bacterium]|nr:hypothetical protein [Actinomycetota bacterium]
GSAPMRRFLPPALVVAALAVAALGCTSPADSEGEMLGIITEVTGDLSIVESFVVLHASGDSFKFSPGPGMTVMGAPASHLRDHVLSGETMRVLYIKGSDGALTAINVRHADAEPGQRHDG